MEVRSRKDESGYLEVRRSHKPNARQGYGMMFPKHKYVRSVKLLKLVSSLECQSCGSGHMVQAAHSNWGSGKGRGIKADDNAVAALCLKCHYEVDQGKNLTKEERQKMWEKAHKKTIQTLINSGKWPDEVPIP